MMRHYLIAICTISLILSSGCSSDPNELYQSACQDMEAMKTEAKSYSEAQEFYESARGGIEKILAKSESSEVALGLTSGQIKIAGMPLDKFKKLENILKLRAAAEKEPLFCSLVFAKAIPADPERDRYWDSVSTHYDKVGEKEKINQILAPILEDTTIIKNSRERTYALLAIMKSSDRARQNELDNLISTQMNTKFNASAINSITEDIPLEMIAKTYAESGEPSKAMETTSAIKSVLIKASTLASIAESYAKCGQEEKADQIFTQALNMIETIPYESDGLSEIVLAGIAEDYAGAGRFIQAIDTAEKIREKDKKDKALAGIAQFYAEVRQFTRALELVRTIEDDQYKASALCKIAFCYIEADQQPGEDEKEVLRELVLSEYPMNSMWE